MKKMAFIDMEGILIPESIYSRFVSNILVNQDKQVVVTQYLKHRGKAILVLTFKMIAERLNLIRLDKYWLHSINLKHSEVSNE